MTRTIFQVSAALCLTAVISLLLPPAGGNVFNPLATFFRSLMVSKYTFDQIKARLTKEEGGHVDKITRSGTFIVVEGWAIDIKARIPAKSVQFFIGQNNVGQVIPSFDRPDVGSFGVRPLFGFRGIVQGSTEDSVRAFAETSDGSISELHQPAPNAQ